MRGVVVFEVYDMTRCLLVVRSVLSSIMMEAAAFSFSKAWRSVNQLVAAPAMHTTMTRHACLARLVNAQNTP